ncbi:MAG: O-antigen ligase family protein [Planctomycetes bacterium]|nr:O-antigen ligase family protein [Planctomycetota bacterium]
MPDRRAWSTLALLAIAAIPFQALWLDFEVARRGVVACLAAVLAMTLHRRWPEPIPSNAKWFGALVGWLLLTGTWWATNSGEAFLRVAYFAALWVVLVDGTTRSRAALASAAAIVASIVSAYGIAQAFGLEWPSGYAVSQAVSTLGNRNVASEFVTMCLAVVIAAGERRRLGIVLVAIIAGSFYLGLNGSRSGLLALAGACACGIAFRRERALAGATSALALVLAGLGFLAAPAKHVGEAPAATPETVTITAPSTIEVRKEIWRAGLGMVADAPLRGHGAGQFRYDYPPFRTAREIDLSSFGRRFASFAATAHDDHLELAIEGGVPAAAMWIAFLVVTFVAGWRSDSRLGLAPLVAFVLLASVRSPLTNGPAALLAFAWFGATNTPSSVRSNPRVHLPLLVLGLACGFVGAATVAAQFCVAEFRAIPPSDRAARAPWIQRAIALHPTESRFYQLALRNQWRPGEAGAADTYAATESAREHLFGLDPNNPTALFYLAEFAHAAGDASTAEVLLARVLQIDPPNPEARLLLGIRQCLSGDLDAGLSTLYTDLHPSLRADLSVHLRDLAAAVGARDPNAATRLEREHRIVAAVDALLDPTTQAHPRLLASDDDPRTLVIVACRVLARGDRNAADERAPERLELDAAARALLAPLLERLRELPRWRRALDG